MATNQTTKKAPQKRPQPEYMNKVITMTLKAPCESAILHDYMERYEGLLVTMFERLGGLLQLIKRDQTLLEMVRLWHRTSLGIANAQLAELQVRREALEMQLDEDVEIPHLEYPANWNLEFVVTHPIAHDLVKLVKGVNEEIKANEALFFAGAVTDEYLERVKNETVSILSGVSDRIAKATSPGKRVAKGSEQKVYSAIELANYIRNGFRLEFSDIPQAYASHIAEYEKQTAAFKTVKTNDVVEA